MVSQLTSKTVPANTIYPNLGFNKPREFTNRHPLQAKVVSTTSPSLSFDQPICNTVNFDKRYNTKDRGTLQFTQTSTTDQKHHYGP